MKRKSTQKPSLDTKKFLSAQDYGNSYENACHELTNGQKQSHWIWYVFPQLAGLGSSYMCQKYAINSLDEARAYLANRKLHDRLTKITEIAVQQLKKGVSPHSLFNGSVDAIKFRSSMTLFFMASQAPEDRMLFLNALYEVARFGELVGLFCDKTASSLLDKPEYRERGIEYLKNLDKTTIDPTSISDAAMNELKNLV